MRVCGVSSSCENSVFEVRPRRASELAVCSCGNKRGTRESEELLGIAAPSDPVGSIIVEILHSVEGGRRVRVLEPRNKSPVFAIALSLSLLVFISCMLILSLSLYA